MGLLTRSPIIMTSTLLTFLMLVLCARWGITKPLPSCEKDTEQHCLGEDADLSPEGIASCLHGLADGVRSDGCAAYLQMLDGCAQEIGRGGVCNGAHVNGETAACLIQRTSRDALSDACASALPVQEPKTGLRDKFWADGKRVLEDDEIATLNDEDHEDYKRLDRCELHPTPNHNPTQLGHTSQRFRCLCACIVVMS